MFDHSITGFVFLMNMLGKPSDLPFSRKSDRKEEKSVVSFTHEQYIICNQTQLDNIAHWQTSICSSYLQVTCGLSANEKEETFASNDNSIKRNKVNNQSN